MALHGGFLLTLPQDWSGARCEQWLAQENLENKGALPGVANTFRIGAEPGLPTIEAANRARLRPGVVTAVPDWTLELSSR
jgi:hypothetical protein